MVPRASYDCHFTSRLVHVAHFCATALPLFEEEAQFGRLPRAHAAPRRLLSLRALWKGTTRARGRPSSVPGHAPTCQPRRPRREPACACSVLVRQTTLPLSGEEAQHARVPRARAVPGGLKLALTRYKRTAPARGLSFSVQRRGVTYQRRSLHAVCTSHGNCGCAPLCSTYQT